jgi:adenylate cyclase
MRGIARASLGMSGWRQDFDQAMAAARDADAMTRASAIYYTYISALAFGLLAADETMLARSAGNYELAKQAGEDIAEYLSETVHGVVLACRDGADRAAGIELLEQARESALDQVLAARPIANCYIAREHASRGDVDGAIESARATVTDLTTSGRCVWIVLATTTLVETLLARRKGKDLDEADAAVDALAAAPIDPGYVVNDIAVLRLRAQLAHARGNHASYRDFRDRYRAMAMSLGFEGHIAIAEAMT